jgi:hypothetical protein
LFFLSSSTSVNSASTTSSFLPSPPAPPPSACCSAVHRLAELHGRLRQRIGLGRDCVSVAAFQGFLEIRGVSTKASSRRRETLGRCPSHRLAANEVPPSFGKSLFAPDCVVADAVAVEPVSQVEFPANREINREFCQFSPDSQPALLSSRNDSAGLE